MLLCFLGPRPLAPTFACGAALRPTPQATRPLAAAVHRAVNHLGADGGPPPDPQSSNRLLNKRGQAAGDWDVSQMAPKLKEQQ